RSLIERDAAAARRVIEEQEPVVNRLEIDNEDAIINLMALHQPEAGNLRTLTACIKINNDLERIGDHAVNIAEAALYLVGVPQLKPLVDIPRMAEQAIGMLKGSLDAFTRGDPALARDVCVRDSIVDALNDQVKRELVTYMTSDAKAINRALKLMMVSLNLERIADLATNLAEDTIYITTGEDIKHHCNQTNA
ncbi:MAG: phosphate signaling complex protein PhoU, partial [bacterium]